MFIQLELANYKVPRKINWKRLIWEEQRQTILYASGLSIASINTKLTSSLHASNTNLRAEGPFQSDALLVPEHCLFDHIHNQTKCWNFDQWNGTAGRACSDRSMRLRSFAMLLPCGIDVFSGVEFVCCPAKKARKGQRIQIDVLFSVADTTFVFTPLSQSISKLFLSFIYSVVVTSCYCAFSLMHPFF